MRFFLYPVELLPEEEGGFTVTFPDVPEAITCGDDLEEALTQAVDALEEALAGYMCCHKAIPHPSPAKKGTAQVAPGSLIAAKASLYETLRQSGISQAELARRTGQPLQRVQRLLSPKYTGRFDQFDLAFAVLGHRLVFTLESA